MNGRHGRSSGSPNLALSGLFCEIEALPSDVIHYPLSLSWSFHKVVSIIHQVEVVMGVTMRSRPGCGHRVCPSVDPSESPYSLPASYLRLLSLVFLFSCLSSTWLSMIACFQAVVLSPDHVADSRIPYLHRSMGQLVPWVRLRIYNHII